MTSSRDTGNQTPLHRACSRAGTAAAVAALLQADSASASALDRKGHTPLHAAIRSGAPADVVELLLRAAPATASARSCSGGTPLHLVREGTPAASVAALLRACPRAAEAGAGVPACQLPLHAALMRNAAADGVRLILSANAAAAFARTSNGLLPLHLAPSRSSAEIVKLILDAYPEAAALPDDTGNIPLHLLSRETQEGVAALLIAANPAGALQANAMGRRPLHQALSRGAPAEAVAALLEAAPGVAAEKDGDGALPLHYAVGSWNGQSWGSADVVAVLLCANSAAAATRSSSGLLPLHTAAQCSAGRREPGTEGALLAIAEAYPPGTEDRSEGGDLRTKALVSSSACRRLAWRALCPCPPERLREREAAVRLLWPLVSDCNYKQHWRQLARADIVAVRGACGQRRFL